MKIVIFHTFLVYLQILLQTYGTNQCLFKHWLKHKWKQIFDDESDPITTKKILKLFFLSNFVLSASLLPSAHWFLWSRSCILAWKEKTQLVFHSLFCTTHYILHTTHYTLHTTYYPLHTSHYTLHTTHYITHYTAHCNAPLRNIILVKINNIMLWA